MAHDDAILELLRDRFNKVDDDLRKIAGDLADHYDKDEHYWNMIDAQQVQLTLIKKGATAVVGTGLLGWLATKFGGGLFR